MKDIYSDVNMMELQQYMPYLMELMKKHRPTYSDTPGHGNMNSFQFPQSTFNYNEAQMDSDKKLLGQQQLLQKHPMNMQDRYALEQMLMDRDASRLDQQRRMGELYGKYPPTFRPERGTSYGPEPMDEITRKAFRRGLRSM